MFNLTVAFFSSMSSSDIATRKALFVVGCLGSRAAIANLARVRPDLLPSMGRLALGPALGFALIYLFKLRPAGREVFPDTQIWWDHVRPVHAVLWGLFAHYAIQQHPEAWRFLAVDTALGAAVWYRHRVLNRL
jgi:hypothetical protein